MRAWIDPEHWPPDLTAGDVVNSLREQNVQVAAGAIGHQPAAKGAFQYALTTLGRLTEPDDFGNIIIKTGDDGQVIHSDDAARTQSARRRKTSSSDVEGEPSTGLGVFQLPGSNALETADRVKAKMEELSRRFPEGVKYHIYYDTTPYISESIRDVFSTLRDAVLLVALVVLVFLQNWRSALIPLIAVPVAIIGTFAAMAVMGFSLNTLSLFGLVLAIGIVVDDAIVVVEATEHHIEEGMTPRAPPIKRWPRCPLRSSLLAWCWFGVRALRVHHGNHRAVFRQFALTIAVSTVLSAFNSLTLSPALCADSLEAAARASRSAVLVDQFCSRLVLQAFQQGFSGMTTHGIGGAVRTTAPGQRGGAVVYGGLLFLTVEFREDAHRFYPQPGSKVSVRGNPASRFGFDGADGGGDGPRG